MALPTAGPILPYYTSDTLIDAVQRKIAMPLSQQTFQPDDILKFANEEMMLGTAPSVMIYHQEYFVFPVVVPLVNNQSRYAIPDRAIGVRFRDVFYQDTNNPPNLFEMTRVDADDKAFFQRNVGANSAIHKFYIEGNDIVLVPQQEGAAIGSLVFYIYLRPNQLVQNSRAATCTSITTTPSSIPLNFLSNSTFIQINPTNTITIPNHGLVNGNKVTLSTTGTLPNGLLNQLYYVVTSTTNTFQLSLTIGGPAVEILDTGAGLGTITRTLYLTTEVLPQAIDFTTGTFTVTNNDYANNQQVMWYNIGGQLPTPLNDNTLYYIINRTINTFQLSTSIGGAPITITFNGTGANYISSDLTTVAFDAIPANITNNSQIDFLQTGSGHKTYAYNVLVPTNGISGNNITFLYTSVPNQSSLNAIVNHYVGPFGPEVNFNCWDHWFACNNGVQFYYNGISDQALSNAEVPGLFAVGDYICSASECIIPQVPSDLHNGLAERTCGRILAALGDQAGLQNVNTKLGEVNAAQGTLLDNRSEGNGMKITARHSLLRYGRFFGRRRV